MLYTRHEDKNSAHCKEAKPGARSHQEKKGKTNSIVVVLLCGAACSEPAEAQLAVVVGTPARWWLLPRLTISTVEKGTARALWVAT